MGFCRLMVLFLYGFAGIAVAEAGEPPAVLTWNGVSYVDLKSLADRRGFSFAWDPLSRCARITGSGGRDLRFRAGSEYALNQGRLLHLEQKALFLNGVVAAPLSAAAYIEDLRSGTLPLSVTGRKFKRVVIDAGHGGHDTGAISPGGMQEKDLVLEISRKLRDRLEAEGLEVIMTRDVDIFVPLAERSRIANRKDADFFVSVHANSAESRSLSGFETYYLSEAANDLALAVERAENSPSPFENGGPGTMTRDLKTILWDMKESENRKQSVRAAACISEAIAQSAEVTRRRQLSANFYVLRWTECPAVLVETGYLSNAADERRLRSPDYHRRVVEGIARGMLQYRTEFEATDGFTR